MLSERSKNIRKNKKTKCKSKYTQNKAPNIGNPDILLDHFSSSNLLENRVLPGLKFDPSKNRYISIKKLEEEQKIIRDLSKPQEKFNSNSQNLQNFIKNLSILNFYHKSKFVFFFSYKALINSIK